MTSKKQTLFTDFPAVTTEQWIEKITADLKGADFNKKLVWKTNEGFNLQPFYRAEDIAGMETTNSIPGKFPYLRGTKEDNNWFVRQNIKVVDAKQANEKALDLLNKGVNSFGFEINKADLSAEFVSCLLKNIDAEAVELNFSTCISCSAKLLGILAQEFKKQGATLEKCQGSVNFDAFKKPLIKGITFDNWAKLSEEVLAAAKELPYYRCLMVNAYNFNNAGSYISQELGFALACGNEYLRQLTEAGISAATVANKIKFNFGISSNYFMEIAKFRAARLLWAKIVEAYQTDTEAAKMNAYAITSEWNMSIYDVHVNLLRTQTEAMSAALGGVNSLTVLPFDTACKSPDDFSERIARNQQLLLKEEVNFDKVTDPAAGSYYIETLTASIAGQAWEIFLEIEEKGGFYAAVKEGFVQNSIKESAQKRNAAVASRREILLGTNQYPNFTETVLQKIENETCGCGCAQGDEIQKLNFTRGASEFETLRLSTEKTTKRPKVFMLTTGNLAMRLARAQFSCNFFACAGYEVIDNLGFETVEEGVTAAQKVGADIIVLCSSDDEYAELAPTTFKTIAGKQIFVVAGNPACAEDLKVIGIENFINVKSNVLETLKGFNKILEQRAQKQD